VRIHPAGSGILELTIRIGPWAAVPELSTPGYPPVLGDIAEAAAWVADNFRCEESPSPIESGASAWMQEVIE